jgi:hypothetical protein
LRHDGYRFRSRGIFDFDGLVGQSSAEAAIRYDLSGKAPRFILRRGGALRGQSACRSSLGSGLRVIQHHALPDFVGAGRRTLRDQVSAFAACSWSASVDLGFC